MKQRLQGMLAGLLIGAIMAGGLVFAKQGREMIEVEYVNVKLYVDGVLITPKDGNGNIVEPFISNGTTYLPVRAVSEALGKDVRWDGSTNSVIIGLMPGDTVYFDDVMQPYQTEGEYWLADISKTDRNIPIAGVKYYHGVANGEWHRTFTWDLVPSSNTIVAGYYNLDAKYSQLSGMYGPCDDGAADECKISFYGDGRLIKTLEFKKNDMPKDFSVDLTGVLQLKIELVGTNASIVNWQIK